MKKPKVFIASSTAGLRVAEAAKKALEFDAEATLWSEAVFKTRRVPIENLMAALNVYDFGLFVLLPEDPLQLGDHKKMSVRDNVLFELGLFLGRTGRDRSFFIMPKDVRIEDLHLPSDLAGISPASYDPTDSNLVSSVGNALFEFKEMLRPTAITHQTASVLYDGRNNPRPSQFLYRNGHIWEKDRKVGNISDGDLRTAPDGLFQLDRRNVDGRYEIEWRPNGRRVPSIVGRPAPADRVLRVSCELKVERGAHTVRFVLKNYETGKWEADQSKRVTSSDWERVDMYLHVPPTANLLFRIDDLEPERERSQLQLRNLEIVEEA